MKKKKVRMMKMRSKKMINLAIPAVYEKEMRITFLLGSSIHYESTNQGQNSTRHLWKVFISKFNIIFDQ